MVLHGLSFGGDTSHEPQDADNGHTPGRAPRTPSAARSLRSPSTLSYAASSLASQPSRNDQANEDVVESIEIDEGDGVETENETETESQIETESQAEGNVIETQFRDEQIAEGATVLDPTQSARQYWTDPSTRIQREVWRPSDGDGDKAADYFGRAGPLPLVEKRWRFYQSQTGDGPIKSGVNEPPKYVILDDCTAYECFKSNIPRRYLQTYWDHDFAGAGYVRARRPHRGRGAVGDADAEGDDKYNFVKVGSKGERYYFTGEKEYKPIIYRIQNPQLAVANFKPARLGRPMAPPRGQLPPNRHGHNQHTPKDQMVKYGAPHKGTNWARYRQRVSAFLPRDKSPPRGHKTGMSVLHARDPVEAMLLPSAAAQRGTPDSYEGGRPSKRQKTGTPHAPLEMSSEEDDDAMFERGEQDMDEPNILGDGEAPMYGVAGDEARDEHVDRPPREKLVEEPDIFSQMLAGQQGTDTLTSPPARPVASVTALDSGSYAAQLEAELTAAKKTIAQLQKRVSELESATIPASASE